MRREVLSALQSARRGDESAQLYVGRCYLAGADSFPCQRPIGVRYLSTAAINGSRQARHELAETLTLDELIRHRLLDLLRTAAVEGNAKAQFKLGLWLLTEPHTRDEGQSWLRRAAAAGVTEARVALAESLLAILSPRAHDEAIRLLRAEAIAGNGAAWLPLARAALTANDLSLFAAALVRGAAQCSPLTLEASRLIVASLALERNGRIAPLDLAPHLLSTALEQSAGSGDPEALLLLGRVLSGTDENLRTRARLPSLRKLGRGIAMLMRAADAGQVEALVALADTYEQHRKLPSSQRMTRYYLERASSHGVESATLRLGRLLLASAHAPDDAAEAVSLLHPLAMRGQPEAAALLRTLVLEVAGDDALAESKLAIIATRNALLGARLALARTFGLTQHESLTLDVLRARRRWGLWVDSSAFFQQRRKSTPRAVPALSEAARRALARAAATFERIDPGPSGPEGDYRTRVYSMRTALAKVGASDLLFFPPAASVRQLDAMRGGRNWHLRYRNLFAARLADAG